MLLNQLWNKGEVNLKSVENVKTKYFPSEQLSSLKTEDEPLTQLCFW
jgi:hypothetical protein